MVKEYRACKAGSIYNPALYRKIISTPALAPSNVSTQITVTTEKAGSLVRLEG